MKNAVVELNKVSAITQYELTPEAVTVMVKEYDSLAVIPGDTASYKEVRAALTMLVHTRTATDRRRKNLGEEARTWIKEINGAAKQLLAPLEPLENRFRAELKAEDNRKAEIKAEKVRIEQARIDGIRAKIDEIKTWCYQGIAYRKPSATIRLILLRLEKTLANLTESDYMEFLGETQDLLRDAITQTRDALSARLQWEKEEEDRKAEAARLAEIRKQQEAERERIEAEQRRLLEEREKIEAEKRRQEEEAERKEFERQAIAEAEKKARVEAEKRIQEAEDSRIKAEIAASEAKERAEKDAMQKAKETERLRLAKEAEKKALALLAPDKEKLIAYAEALQAVPKPTVKASSMDSILSDAVRDLRTLTDRIVRMVSA
ncbi:MAG: hypothetical protein JRI41_06065 [Deltaproteobacteria bacterium]|nr:hypothetical protein [Deltaproteobacteria bacterium]